MYSTATDDFPDFRSHEGLMKREQNKSATYPKANAKIIHRRGERQ